MSMTAYETAPPVADILAERRAAEELIGDAVALGCRRPVHKPGSVMWPSWVHRARLVISLANRILPCADAVADADLYSGARRNMR